MAIIRNILVRVGADIKGYQSNLNKAKGTLNNFAANQKKTLNNSSNGLKSAMNGIGDSIKSANLAVNLLKAAVAGLSGALAVTGVQAAMEYESSLQQINRIMGENAKGFIEWANTQSTAYNMSRLEAVKYGAVYGNLMSTITNSQATATQYTTDLLKASAVVASATGRNMTDVMERIRSGLLGNTEAIEDLGINVNVAMLESTAAFQRFANGSKWEDLSFQVQQQIRLFAILEQAANKFGANVYNNTASSLAQFTAILKDVQLNIGQAFLPLINAVMPTLITFANGLKYVTAVFAQFMQALFGVKTKQIEVAQASVKMANAGTGAAGAQKKLAKATKDAGKAAKGSLAAFDEINQLQEQMANSGADAAEGAGGGVGGGGMIVPDSGKGISPIPENLIPQSVIDSVNRFKEALRPIGAYIRELWDIMKGFWSSIQPLLQPIIEYIVKVFTPVWQGLVQIVGTVFETLKEITRASLLILQGIFEVFAALLKGDWSLLWQGIKNIVKGYLDLTSSIIIGAIKIIKIAWDTIVKTFTVVWQVTWEAIKNFAAGIWEGIKTVASTAWEGIKSIISGVWNWLVTDATISLQRIKDDFIGTWNALKAGTENIWSGIVGSIKGALNLIIGAMNYFIRKLNTIKFSAPDWEWLPNAVQGKSWGIDISEIPYLAKGGIVTSPTLAMVGERGAEAVVPLQDTSFVDTLASAIGSAVLSAMQFSQQGTGQGGTEAIIQVDSTKLARVLIPAINKENNRMGNTAIVSSI